MGLSSLTGGSKYKLRCVLLKLASSLESLDEPRCGLIRLKNDRRADVELRRADDVSPSAESPSKRNSSSTLEGKGSLIFRTFRLVVQLTSFD